MADYDDPELTVKVTTESDNSGTVEAERSLDGFKGKASEAASEMRHFTGSSREGLEIFRAIGAAARGSGASIAEMTRGMRSLVLVVSHSIGEGPLGVLLIALGLISGAMIALKGHAKEAAEGIDGAGKASEDAAKRMESIKKAVDEDFKPLEDELKRINEQFATLKQRRAEAEGAAKSLDSAQKELRDNQLELGHQQALSSAKTPEETEYINKKFEAQKKVNDATDKMNEVGNAALELQTKAAAADDEAAKKSEDAAKGRQKVTDAEEKFAAAKKKAAIANSEAIEAAGKSEALQAKVADVAGAAPYTPLVVKGILDGLTHPAETVAGTLSKEAKGASQAAADAGNKLKDENARQAVLDEAAAKAKVDAEIANKAATDAKEAASIQLKAAEIQLAAAEVAQKDVDKPKVTGTGKGESEGVTRGPREKSESKAQREAEEAALNHDSVAAYRAASGIVGHLKSTAESTKRIGGAVADLASVSTTTAKKVDKHARQAVNAGSYTGP